MKGFKPDPDGIEAEVRKQQERGVERVKATGEVFSPIESLRQFRPPIQPFAKPHRLVPREIESSLGRADPETHRRPA